MRAWPGLYLAGRRRGGLRRRLRGRHGRLLLRGRLLLEPGLEIGLRAHIDHDRHESVIAAAELRALAAVEPGLVGIHPEPGLVDETGDGVLLHREDGHP